MKRMAMRWQLRKLQKKCRCCYDNYDSSCIMELLLTLWRTIARVVYKWAPSLVEWGQYQWSWVMLFRTLSLVSVSTGVPLCVYVHIIIHSPYMIVQFKFKSCANLSSCMYQWIKSCDLRCFIVWIIYNITTHHESKLSMSNSTQY